MVFGIGARAKITINVKKAQNSLEKDCRHNNITKDIGTEGSALYLWKNTRGGNGLFRKNDSMNFY